MPNKLIFLSHIPRPLSSRPWPEIQNLLRCLSPSITPYSHPRNITTQQSSLPPTRWLWQAVMAQNIIWWAFFLPTLRDDLWLGDNWGLISRDFLLVTLSLCPCVILNTLYDPRPAFLAFLRTHIIIISRTVTFTSNNPGRGKWGGPRTQSSHVLAARASPASLFTSVNILPGWREEDLCVVCLRVSRSGNTNTV